MGKNDKRAGELVQSAIESKRDVVRNLPPTVTGVYLKDTPQFSAVDLGPGGGLAINGAGQAVGFAQNSSTGLFQPVLFKGHNFLPVPAGQQGIGRSINAAGIVGGYTFGGGAQAAGIWQPNGTYVPLTGLGGPTGKENAVYGCTDTKPLVCFGTSDVGGAAHATSWSIGPPAASTPIAVGDFPGASGAFAVNNRSIFGGSFFDQGSTGRYSPYIASSLTKKELVLWRPEGGSGVVLALDGLSIAGGSVTDAARTRGALWWGSQHSVLGPTTMPSTIRGVNDLGLAIGDTGSTGQTHAALFLGGRTIDLSHLVAGYTLIRGDAVTNKDQLLVDGRDAQGKVHVLLLKPKSARKH